MTINSHIQRRRGLRPETQVRIALMMQLVEAAGAPISQKWMAIKPLYRVRRVRNW